MEEVTERDVGVGTCIGGLLFWRAWNIDMETESDRIVHSKQPIKQISHAELSLCLF